MSRVQLASIRSLTFYKDEETASRRGIPIPQLTCIGKPCKLYQPEAVRCTNLGGTGTDVDWKCEADLPESLRFGKVAVSCEGWDGPGDPYVLKGSCGLQYRLVQIPGGLRRGDDPRYPSRLSSWLYNLAQDPTALLFSLLWLFVFCLILYNIFKSCFGGRAGTNHRPNARGPPPRRPGSSWFLGFGGGGIGGGRPDTTDAPPPYSKYPGPSSSNRAAQPPANDGGWFGPGFWTGAAMGGLGTYFLNRQTRDRERDRTYGMYDWEAERRFYPVRTAPNPISSGLWGGAQPARRHVFDDDDRGEGPSNLGRMRRSTGLGGSNVR